MPQAKPPTVRRMDVRNLTAEETEGKSLEWMRERGFCGGMMADKVHRCRNWAGARTNHPGYGECKYHAGNRGSNRMVAAKDELADRSYTMKVEIEPVEALRQALYMAAGSVAYCQLKIQTLEEREVDFDFNDMGYHATADSRLLATWMSLYAKEREALVAIAEKCLKAGIAERHVRAIEHRAGLLGDALAATLAESDLSSEQKQSLIAGLRRNLAKLTSLPATTQDGRPPYTALPAKSQREAAERHADQAAIPADYEPAARGVFDEG